MTLLGPGKSGTVRECHSNHFLFSIRYNNLKVIKNCNCSWSVTVTFVTESGRPCTSDMYLLIVNRQKWDDSLDDHASALWEMRDGNFLVFSPLFSGDDEPDSSRVLLMENANFNLPPSPALSSFRVFGVATTFSRSSGNCLRKSKGDEGDDRTGQTPRMMRHNEDWHCRSAGKYMG